MSFITVKKVKNSKTMQPFLAGIDVVLCIFFGSQFFKSQVQGNKVVWAFFFILVLLLLVKNFRKMQMLKKLFLMDSVLAASEKESVPVLMICEKIGGSEKSVSRLINKLIKKGYLHSCTLSTGDVPEVVIEMQTEDGRTERQLECPSCGTVFTVKAGTVARCPECASIVSD